MNTPTAEAQKIQLGISLEKLISQNNIKAQEPTMKTNPVKVTRLGAMEAGSLLAHHSQNGLSLQSSQLYPPDLYLQLASSLSPYQLMNPIIDKYIMGIQLSDCTCLKDVSQCQITIPVVDDRHVCQFCYQQFLQQQGHYLKPCQHFYHKKCLIQLIKEKLNSITFDRIACAFCKQENIDSIISFDQIANILVNDPSLQLFHNLMFNHVHFESQLQIGQKIAFCRNEGCGYFCLVDFEQTLLKCQKCGKETCLFCQTIMHTDLSCQQNNQIRLTDKLIINKFEGKMTQLAIQFRQLLVCKKCSTAGIKTQGCYHITCLKCEYEWCQICQQYPCDKGDDYHFLMSNKLKQQFQELSGQIKQAG